MINLSDADRAKLCEEAKKNGLEVREDDIYEGVHQVFYQGKATGWYIWPTGDGRWFFQEGLPPMVLVAKRALMEIRSMVVPMANAKALPEQLRRILVEMPDVVAEMDEPATKAKPKPKAKPKAKPKR